MTTASSTYRTEDAYAAFWTSGGRGLPRAAGWGDALADVGGDVRSLDEAIAAAGLGWTVEQHPLRALLPDGVEVDVPGHLANVRSDTRGVLGVVGDGYVPVQNREALALAESIVDGGGASWLGAGATRGGARVHALLQLDRTMRIGGAEGEDILPLVCVRNGHDGSASLAVSVAPFRLICLNGLLVPVDGAVRAWRTRHTRNVGSRTADARRALGIATRYYDRLEQLGERMIRERMSAPEFERFLARLVPLPEGESDPGGRRVENVERVRLAIRSIHEDTADADAIRGTRWGAFQAVTAYHDHHAAVRRRGGRPQAEMRFERAISPAPLKDRALALLTA